MDVNGATALVTGSNRGLGQALVKALLDRGAARVYAAARGVGSLAPVVALDPKRVIPLSLDVAIREQIAALPKQVPDVRLLINNAGVLDFGSAFDVSLDALDRSLAVNFYGPLLMARALAPIMETNGGGAIVNVLSFVAMASRPAVASYSASKAASWSMTQSLRASLDGRAIAVHGVFPGPIDTEMATTAEIPLAKTSPADVANAILDGIAAGKEDIFPDPWSASVYEAWRTDHKAVERQFAA